MRLPFRSWLRREPCRLEGAWSVGKSIMLLAHPDLSAETRIALSWAAGRWNACFERDAFFVTAPSIDTLGRYGRGILAFRQVMVRSAEETVVSMRTSEGKFLQGDVTVKEDPRKQVLRRHVTHVLGRVLGLPSTHRGNTFLMNKNGTGYEIHPSEMECLRKQWRRGV